MKIGDLVRDTERGDLGLVIVTDVDLVIVMFSIETEWLSKSAYLEVLYESR